VEILSASERQWRYLAAGERCGGSWQQENGGGGSWQLENGGGGSWQQVKGGEVAGRR
jgi:hypothetical protein